MANIRYNFSSGSNGTINYNTDIVYNIVAIAAKETQGVTAVDDKGGIKLSFEKENVSVDVTVSIDYSANVPTLAYKVQSAVKQAIESMTRYKVIKINVHIADVLLPEENTTSLPGAPTLEEARAVNNTEPSNQETKTNS